MPPHPKTPNDQPPLIAHFLSPHHNHSTNAPNTTGTPPMTGTLANLASAALVTPVTLELISLVVRVYRSANPMSELL